MNDQNKTREQLIAELDELRQQVANHEAELARSRQAEAALRESEERFRRVFEDGPLGVVLVDLEARIQHVNRRFCKTLGYSEQEIIELGLRGITHPDDWEPDRNLGARLRHGEIPTYTIDKRYQRKDGQVIWGQLTASLLHDAAGRPTHIIGMVEDITLRKQSEEALLESERRLNTLLANLPGAVYRCKADRNWTVEFLSDGYRPLTGYDPAQLIGQPGTRHSDLIHADDRQREWDVMERALAEKRAYQVEYRLRTATGQEKWVWEQGTGVFSDSGELVAIEGFTTDVTARKRAEEELQEAHDRLDQRVRERTAELTEANARLRAEVEQRRQAEESLTVFRRFAEAATQGFGMTNKKGEFLYVNPVLARLFGRATPEEVIGKHISNFYPQEYLERREREIIPALRRQEDWHGEYTMVFPDGKRHHTIHTIFPVLDENGDMLCAAAVITDISELKQAEEKLKTEQRALRRMVLAGDHERRLITYELHDGVAQQLVGAMMHFQTPELSGRRKSKAATACRDAVDALRQALSELRMVMNRLRAPVLDKFGLTEAIEDVAAQLRLTPGAPEIEYRHAVQFQRLEPTLENSLFRIAQESLTNACRYSKSKKVRVTLTQKGGEVTLEIRDWGIGFEQAAVAENRFGLEGIRERARILGGKLSIKSKPGDGTVVRVKFPVIEAPRQE